MAHLFTARTLAEIFVAVILIAALAMFAILPDRWMSNYFRLARRLGDFPVAYADVNAYCQGAAREKVVAVLHYAQSRFERAYACNASGEKFDASHQLALAYDWLVIAKKDYDFAVLRIAAARLLDEAPAA